MVNFNKNWPWVTPFWYRGIIIYTYIYIYIYIYIYREREREREKERGTKRLTEKERLRESIILLEVTASVYAYSSTGRCLLLRGDGQWTTCPTLCWSHFFFFKPVNVLISIRDYLLRQIYIISNFILNYGHSFWCVFKTESYVRIETIKICFSWSTNTCVSMCRGL